MFNFLKQKLKSALNKFKRDVEETAEEKEEKIKAEKKEKPEEIKKETEKKEIKETKEEKPEQEKETEEKEIKEKPKETKKEIKKEKKGFISRVKEAITTTTISEKQFDKLFWDLELAMLESNVAVSVIEKIKENLKSELVDQRIKKSEIQKIIEETLKKSLLEILSFEKFDLFNKIKKKKPFIICFFGTNGSGKTTTIAKIAKTLKDKGITSVIAASDTFRAAALEQIEEHAKKIGVKLIKHDYGADAAAVSYDAIQYAKAHGIDVVLIDTAGRSHSNINLMDELNKIIRVTKPDLNIFVGDSLTGNDIVEQVQKYDSVVGINAIILTKADVDEKGGSILSSGYVTKKPIIFLGTGQDYDNLEEFNPEKLLEKIGV